MMTTLPIAQFFAAVFVVATPWIAVRIALVAAYRHLQVQREPLVRSKAVAALDRATVGAFAIVVGFAALWPSRSAWLALVGGALFVPLSALALRLLRQVDAATRAARYVNSTAREASLAARHHHHYLSLHWRLLLYAVTLSGVSYFVWRLSMPALVERRLFVPVASAIIAVVFFALYETWIHTLVTTPVAGVGAPEMSRRQWLRHVFVAQWVLVGVFLTLAHGLLDIDWASHATEAAIAEVLGALVGVAGCGYALASDLARRQYVPAASETSHG